MLAARNVLNYSLRFMARWWESTHESTSTGTGSEPDAGWESNQSVQLRLNVRVSA